MIVKDCKRRVTSLAVAWIDYRKDYDINHLLFMDDLKLFAQNEDQIDNLVRIFSEDIKMEFGLPKSGVLIMKRGKVVKTEVK